MKAFARFRQYQAQRKLDAARRKLVLHIHAQVEDADRADAIYALILHDLKEVDAVAPVTSGQLQLVIGTLMASIAKVCTNRVERMATFKRMEKLARQIANFEKEKGAA